MEYQQGSQTIIQKERQREREIAKWKQRCLDGAKDDLRKNDGKNGGQQQRIEMVGEESEESRSPN